MIRFQQVVKSFGGGFRRPPVRALDGVTLEVPPGSALGVAGPNGAGKSTLLRLLLGYLRASSGEVTVGGVSPRAYVERHGIAYVSELIAIPPGWSVRDTLRTFAALGEVEEERARIGQVMEELGIAALAGRRVGTLSKGNLQRLGLAQALLAGRKVMILDEPTHGLDPEWTARLRGLVAQWRAADPERVLLVASHNLEEMERTVQRVAVLREGRLCALLDAPPPPGAVLRLDGLGAAEVAGHVPGARPLPDDPGAYAVPERDPAEMSAQIGRAIAAGGVLRGFAERGESLEARVRTALLEAGE